MFKKINRPKFKTFLLFVVLLAAACNTKEVKLEKIVHHDFEQVPTSIDLEHLHSNGVYHINKQILTPNDKGVIADIVLKLPEYEKGMYYRPFSEVKASGNRMEALWFGDVKELFNYKQIKPREDDNMKLGSFILLQKKDGNYIALLPIVSKAVGNTFDVQTNNFILQTATYGTGSIYKSTLVFICRSS